MSVIGLVLDVVTGPSMLPVGEVVKSLLGAADVDEMTRTIVYDLRLPIALMALVVGAAWAQVAQKPNPTQQSYGKPLHIGIGGCRRFWRIACDCVWQLWFAIAICCACGRVCHDYAGGGGVVFVCVHATIWLGDFGVGGHCLVVYFSVYVVAGAIYFRARNLATNSVLAVW